MKIIQVNGWCGRLNAPLANFIKEERADIVCMQEAFAPGTKALKVFGDQYEFVDEIIKVGEFPYSFFAPSWGFNLAGRLLEIGCIILSKYPLSAQKSFHTHNSYHVREGYDSSPNTRVWQACRIKLPGSKFLSVANYQGYVTGDSIGDEITVKTMQKVRDGLSSLTQPLIFCGDLNVSPESPAMQVLDNLDLVNLTKHHKVKTTLSSVHRAPLKDRNSVPCDYILASKDIKVNGFRVSDHLVSDHKALVLTFDI